MVMVMTISATLRHLKVAIRTNKLLVNIASLSSSSYVCGSISPSLWIRVSGPYWSQQFFGSDSPSDMPRLNQVNMSFSMIRSFCSSERLSNASVGRIVDVPLAQTGEGIAECELLKWYVREGDEVDHFQPLCEVQSDKATIEITSLYKGKVSHILFHPGDIIKVGSTFLKMLVDESMAAMDKPVLPESVSALKSDVYDTSGLGYASEQEKGGVLSTPAVRHLAKEHGIDINHVRGTGVGGRVLKEDVINFAVKMGVIVGANDQRHTKDNLFGVTDSWEYDDKVVPLRGFQRAMARSMTLAAKIPHFHYVEEINCDSLLELKAAFQKENPNSDVKYSFLPLLIKSLSLALAKYPLLNCCFNEESTEIIIRGSHNVGIAMATSHGLVVPNIKKVQSLSIWEITWELCRLQKLAVDNKLSVSDVSGGTITLSNIGAIGGKFGSPLVNAPEVSILAIGRVRKVPQISDDGTVFASSVMDVNVGADHRVLDGATVARFCNEWKQLVEKPERILLHMR